MKYVEKMQSLNAITKVILALPVLDIFWGIYRICQSALTETHKHLFLAIVLLIIGLPFMWAVDILSLLFLGQILWIDFRW